MKASAGGLAGTTKATTTKRIAPERLPRHMLVSRLFEPAFALGAVDPERVQLRNLVQETFLRRHRDDHSAVAQEDRLPKLQVPVAQRQALALEGGQCEIGPLEEIEQGF